MSDNDKGFSFFGYKISKVLGAKNATEVIDTPVVKRDDDSSIDITTGGYYGQNLNIGDADETRSEQDLVMSYRSAASQPECELAISDIIDGAIVQDCNSAPVNLNLNNVEIPDNVKKKVQVEFDKILKLYKFNRKGSDYFKDWYIDGRIYFNIIADTNSTSKGIKEIRQIDPLNLKRIKEIKKTIDKKSGVTMSKVVDEYYIYSEQGFLGNNGNATLGGVKIAKEAIIACNSGLMNETSTRVYSYLHKSTKLVNQLRMMEDALVIYRTSRAPERRIFYIDVGNLPKGKAEEYVQSVMAKYRNKLVYDSSTGEIKDDTKHMSMLEDFYMPRKEGGRGTEITTLPGGDNLGQIDDILFFQKKLYRSLNVPIGRLEPETQHAFGRSSETTREEVKFQKFISKMRKRFSFMLIDALRAQLILKNILKKSEWNEIEEELNIDFIQDNYFSELKEFEILKERLETLNTMTEFIGKYYSNKWIRNNILKQTDDDINTIDKEIEAEPDDTDLEEIDV